jgi:hypothetical protein
MSGGASNAAGSGTRAEAGAYLKTKLFTESSPVMNRILPLAALAAIAACGKPDPTPKPDGSASAAAINAAVQEAQAVAVDAQVNAAGGPDTPEEREKVAKEVLGESNTAAGTPAGAAAARQGRPAIVDPRAGDPLPSQPR